MNIFEFSPNISNFYQIFQHFHQIFGHSMEYFRNLMKLLACRYGRAAFFCPRMMDSCTAIRDNQSASSSDYYFLFLPVLQHTSVNANNRFSYSIVKVHWHSVSTRSALLEEKKIRINRLIMFPRTTLSRLSRLFGFKSTRWCCQCRA